LGFLRLNNKTIFGAKTQMPVPKPTRVNNSAKRSAPAPPPSHAAPTPKKTSDVLKAVREAGQTVEELRSVEAKKGFKAASTKLLAGEMDWKHYLAPADKSNIEECGRIDEYNQSVFEFNNAMAPKVNELMKKLGRDTVRVMAPTKYKATALQRKEEMLFNPEFRILAGVQFLAERDKYPERDYEMYDAPTVADDIAADEEAKRLIDKAGSVGIDIAKCVGVGHAKNCTCENRWDGTSERCIGEGVRVRWRKTKAHHFLRPVIEPEQH